MNASCGRLAIALLCLAGAACTTGESADSLYAEATSALRRGELDRAAEAAARAADNQTAAPDARLAVEVRLLRAEIALAQGRPADAAAFARPTVPEALAETIVDARHSKVLAQIDLASRRIAEAAGRLERAEVLARRHDDGALLREVLLLDGLRLSAGGDPRARVRTEEAYQNAIAAGDAYWQAAALNNLALFRFRAFLYDEALTLFQQALDAARQVGAQRFAAASLTNIGPCYYRLGDLTRARAALEEAARIQEEIGARGNLQASLGELGNLALFEEDLEQAAQLYRRAIDLARQHAPADAARWETNLAAVLTQSGAWDEAARLNDRAASAGEAAGDVSLVGYARLYAGIIALRQGHVDQAEKLLADAANRAGANADLAWQATAELATAAAARGDREAAEKYFEAGLRGVETARAGLRRDHQITFLQPRLRFYRRYIEWRIEQGQPHRALDIVESSRLQLLASRFGRAVEHARSTGADSLRRIARRERAALVSYWITPTRSFAWVITPERVEIVELAAPEAEIARLVQAYRTFLETGLRDPLATEFAPAQDLYRLLVAPIVPLLNGASRVIVAPDGPLHALPFDALVVPGDQPRYWIEDVTLMTAPSLAVLTTAPPRAAAASALLAFGAPEPDVAGLPPLPHASEEISQLAARLPGAKVISGRDATPEAFAAAGPARFARIHFASHAIANPLSPLDSAIMTAPSQAGGSRLLARTLFDTPLSADLVTISACRGAGARVIAGEGLVGFAWVLLHAGARHVIAGLWDVNDRSTLDLMTALYANLDSHPAPAEALREAKRRLLAPGSRFRHPFYWAPFTVFIGPGPSRAAAQTRP